MYLKVDKEELDNWKNKAIEGNNAVTHFVEPDIGYEMTAVAVCGDSAEDLFKDLRLL